MKELLPYILNQLIGNGLRHEVHSFESGAYMIDIWAKDRFYVIQIDGPNIGLSEITEETTPFDIIPDRSFTEAKEFRTVFEAVLSR